MRNFGWICVDSKGYSPDEYIIEYTDYSVTGDIVCDCL